MSLFLEVAQAQGPAAAQNPGLFSTLGVPLLFMFFVFYFLILRPQAKKQKKQIDFLSGLKRGDSVLTSSGILGKIEGITDQWVTLEIAEQVKVRIMKTQITSSAQQVEA